MCALPQCEPHRAELETPGDSSCLLIARVLSTSAALTGVKEGVAVQPVGSGGVEALLSKGEQVVLVQALHVGRHHIHPSLQREIGVG